MSTSRMALVAALLLLAGAASAQDVTPPTVSFFDGTDSPAMEVSIRVHVSFDEPLNPASINESNSQILDSGTPVYATVQYRPATNAISFRPANSLDYSTQYTVKVFGGGSGPTDVAGNHLASDFTGTFTTKAPLVTHEVLRGELTGTIE